MRPSERRMGREVHEALYLKDNIKLILIVFALEKRLSAEDLCEDAAHGPNVDGFRVFLQVKQLRRAVPIIQETSKAAQVKQLK